MQKWARPGLVPPSGGQTAVSYPAKQGDTAPGVCAVKGGGGLTVCTGPGRGGSPGGRVLRQLRYSTRLCSGYCSSLCVSVLTCEMGMTVEPELWGCGCG